MKLGTGILLMDLKCRTQLSALLVKGYGSRPNVKSCPLHNFAMPDGILMKLGTGILLVDLKCRTQLSALSDQRSRSQSRSNVKCQIMSGP